MSEASGQTQATVPIESHYGDAVGVSADDVRGFLLKHPEFFTQHPELLERLVIPHGQKGSVSLVELQSEQLRKKLRQLNYKLNQLIGIAKQNEKIYRVYTDLNVQLLTCTSISDIQLKLEEVLQEQLQLSSVVLKPFKGANAVPELQRRLFIEKRFKTSPFFFGRLSQHEKHLLFGELTAESVALIAIGEQRELGILAVGSSDPSHFTPDMDTLLLKQLQQVLNIIMPTILGY
ncbi:DUF484 family protein [Alteromonas aestuariivivens]|uniref:DUF484 family protein n=1 Tax=Alteromonas aestuariivivens TaxID=1938339 RepID=A0A3D8M7G1_9ALTE|nr:DUF484 family protein [Alteromonas aestuariivivens]RDV25529.1 DUF484 family protein [Alteromonas aestuariivivens]